MTPEQGDPEAEQHDDAEVRQHEAGQHQCHHLSAFK